MNAGESTTRCGTKGIKYGKKRHAEKNSLPPQWMCGSMPTGTTSKDNLTDKKEPT